MKGKGSRSGADKFFLLFSAVAYSAEASLGVAAQGSVLLGDVVVGDGVGGLLGLGVASDDCAGA